MTNDSFITAGESLVLVGPPGVGKITYIPIDRQGANLFFQLVSGRHKRRDHSDE